MHATARTPMTVNEIHELPALVSVETTARALGMAYGLVNRQIREGTFPLPVLKLGPQYRRIRTTDLLRLLGLDPAGTRHTVDTPSVSSGGAGRIGSEISRGEGSDAA